MFFEPTEVDIHTVASLLKLYLRELPAPLIPLTYYEKIIKIVNRDFSVDPDQALIDLIELVQSFPKIPYNMLQYLCRFLQEISRYEEINKMSAMNLATCFVHSFIRPEEDDPALLMGTSNNRTQVTYILISHCQQIFSKEYTVSGGAVSVDNSLVDLGDNDPSLADFDPYAQARHGMQQQNNVSHDPFALDDQRQSVQNLPAPIDPASAAAVNSSPEGSRQSRFSSNLQKGLTRSGSKRGGFIVDQNDSERESACSDPDSELNSPDYNYFAGSDLQLAQSQSTEVSRPNTNTEKSTDINRQATQESKDTINKASPERKSSILREKPQTPPRKSQSVKAPSPAARNKLTDSKSNSMDRIMPSIPPRPQSVLTPTVPPRPKQKRPVSDISETSTLLDTDVSHFSVEQLTSHINNLCKQLRTAQAEKQTMAEGMKKSVKKIAELQTKLTWYETKYGPQQ